jgi:predicted transcriptional regulator
MYRNCDAGVSIMKTATFPSVRVEPELREAAESVLSDGESLSAFVEQSIRANIERRRLQGDFVARGLASRDLAKENGQYVSADEVVSTLEGRLAEAKSGRTLAR